MKTLLIILLALFSTNLVAQTNTIVDTDGDGLIEINDLDALNAIRFQLDGTSYKATAETTTGTTRGCPNDRCVGYELTRNLDFYDEDSYSSTANRIIWTMGAGWQPIGDSSNLFTGRFEGNGFTISNLTINRGRTNGVGLFGYTGSGAEIANVGLLNADITGTSSNVGGLVGVNGGIITNSYATGSISGDSNLGELVGGNSGTIMNSYAVGYISGDKDVGSLAGGNSGTITNSYATGSVRGTFFSIGGLVGGNSGTITNSYATGFVRGSSFSSSDIGGLAGGNSGTITNSYWDVDTSGIQTSAGGTSKTTVALQSPTTATGIYSSWGSDNWDFGTSRQYPVLKYIDNPETDSSECRRAGTTTTTNLPFCGSLLSPTLRYGLSELQLVNGNLSPDFNVVVPSYRGTVVSSTGTIQFRPIAINSDAKVYITANEETRGMAIDSGGESGEISLNTSEINRITIEVENSGETTQTVIYTLYLDYYEFVGEVDRDNDGLIEIDDLEGLNAIRYQLDGAGYRESETAPKVAIGCPNNRCRGYELMRNLDFNDSDSYSSTITYITDAGWQPIGDFSNTFTSQFEGNGFTISNLRIDRSSARGIGLFGYTGSGSEIANVGLLNIDITGDNDVGSLVGSNNGAITNSYATGAILGDDDIGGLVGSNNATITNSYATVAVSGDNDIGGLVGSNFSGTITNGYATGSVLGDDDVGGLVGSNNGTIMSSYWDVDVSGIQTSAGGTSKTTVELQSPTAPGSASNELYYNWSSDDWDFGTSIQYPILKHADNDVLLSGQGVGLRDLEMLTSGAGLSPTFGGSTTHYVINFVAETSDINLRLRTYNTDATIEVVRRGEERNYFENRDGERRTEPIPIDRNTALVITVTEADGGTTIYTISTQALEMPDIAEILGITLSKNGVMDTDNTANEGSRITLGADISGGRNYRYEWTQIQGKSLTLLGSNTASPSFTIPTDYIASATSTSTDIVVQLTLVYGQFNLVSMSSKTITAIKINNGPPRLDSGLTINGLTLSFDDTRVTDSDGSGTASAYQWQRQDINMDRWVDIDSATTKDYTVPRYDPHGRLYGVRVTYTDAQGYSFTENVVGFRKDIDIDHDGLIEIYDLDALNSIRFQLDGTSYKATDGATGITYGCPNDRCRGYELTRNLDFDDDDSYSSTANRVVWTTEEGWRPIGTSSSDPFTGKFEGNGFTISNLMVNRGTEVGLFGYTESGGAEIANVGLLNGDIRGNDNVGGLVGWNNGGGITNSYATGSVGGSSFVGGLVGSNIGGGTITNSYAMGSVSGSGEDVGGLVGWNIGGTITNSYATGSVSGSGNSVGGLVGGNRGTIANSYATGSVRGSSIVGGLGGLVGWNIGGTITNSYAMGSVSGSGEDVGGLVGRNIGGTITNSYAMGSVSGSGEDVGGLVGGNRGTITNSYATGSVSGSGNSVGGLVGGNRGTIANSYATGSVRGSSIVGGLVGSNIGGGTITNSYAMGSVSGSGEDVGGLVGGNIVGGTITNSYATGSVRGSSRVGGLVGSNGNRGTITNSYATGSVRGSSRVGGLVGLNNGSITNSYAMGSVSGSGNSVGGLVGGNIGGTITNSYATSSVSGSGNGVGGLVGRNNNGTSTDSYWDSNTSGSTTSAGGTSKTTVELQSPTAATGIYMNWGSDNWDFGTRSQYPVLKYTDNLNTNSSECRSADDTSTDLPLCGSLLSPILRGLSELQLVQGELSPDFDVAVPNYRGTVVNSASTVHFRPITVNPDAKIYITAGEQTRGLAINSGDESSMISLNINGITTITVEVENGGETTQTVIYTLYLYYQFSKDVDRDDDGLIEIDDLETLNAIRNQLDGSHLQLSGLAPTSVGCALSGCKGYELTRDLDFDDDDSYSSPANRIIWTTGAGWQPIGDSSNVFTGKFEGNGFTISNLKIDRSDADNVGLFGFVGQEAEITNVGLLDVDITGNDRIGGLVGRNDRGTITNSYATGSVSGEDDVGGLVGWNEGTVANSYAIGSVSGSSDVGGLVGLNGVTITNSYATGSVRGSSLVGGLVGWNIGGITNSYATGSVSGEDDIGGLVGWNIGGITNSYATGSASGEDDVGGLVGFNDNGTITNSYATGSASGSSDVGGLVGENVGPITNSYWDSDTSGRATSDGGMSKTTVELQSPTMATGIYRGWGDDWDFGTSSQYPVLRYSNNCRRAGDTSTDLPLCGSLLSPILRGLSELQLVQGELSPDFDVAVPNYRGTVVNSTSTIQFRPITVNPNAKVYITAGEQTRGLAIDSGDESSMISLNTNGITTITVEVENGGETTQTAIYTLYLYYEYRDVDRDDNGLIEIDDLETLNAIRNQLDGSRLQLLSGAAPTSIGCARGGCKGYELTRNLDFDDDDSYSSTANKIIWTMGAGWQPIGDSSSNAFTGKFEGNGFTISNLKINRSDTGNVGLFGTVEQEAEITNVGLLGVDIMGDNFVGSLVGWNSGSTITNSYVTGSVSGFGDNVGGLVGWNSSGTITNSYATGFVLGSGSSVGGLVGENSGTITNSYAKGSVAGSGDSVGGLVGGNSSGTITNSYATGFVLESGNSVGGLVGGNSSGTIINSYWDSDTSGITTSAGGTSKTTVALQSPTTATGIYDSWSNDDWDFGTTKQYPAVKYTPGDDSSNPACDSEPRTPLPSCDSILPGQRGLPPIENTTPTITITPSMPQILPVGSTAHIVVSVVDDNFNLDDTVTLLAISSSRTIVLVTPVQVAGITTDTITTFMLDAKQGGEAIITFTAIDIRGLRDSVELSVRVNTRPTISGIPQQPIRILEGLSTELEVAISDANVDDSLNVRVETSDNMIATATIIATNDTIHTLEISGVSAGNAMITVTVDDGRGVANSNVSAAFEVQVAANTTPTIMITPSLGQTLPLNSTAHIVVSVADDNFNLDDIVTLTAMSSSQTVISVTPAQVADITTDTITTFTLSAEQSGTATIMFTATDIEGLSDNTELSVRVNTAPTISNIPEQPIRLLEGLSTEFDVAINDANTEDNLNVRIDTSDSIIATATIIATNGVTRTLEISGAGVGSAMITVTADDGRGVANSEISEQFEVQVEANTTPTIMITPSTSQTLPLNSTAHIVVSVVDDNFNLNDIVTLAAMPSSQTIVSVVPTQVVGITTDTSRVFMLNAEQGGTATITFTATDIEGLSDSAELLVRVNTAPTLNGIPEQPIRLLEGLSTELDVAISDADADDNLSVRIDTSDSMTATATIIATNDATHTLKISGVGAGNAVITVTVDDGRDVANSNVSAIFEVQVQANTTPTIMITPSMDQTLPLNSTAHIVVLVADDNFNLDDIVTLAAMSSSQTVVSVAPVQVANITTDTSRIFMLNAEQSGTATIMFTATDIGGSSDSAELSVRVNTAPTLSGIPEQPIRLLEGLSTELDVAISDADADDNLSVSIDTSDSMIATAAIIATDDTTRTLEVNGVGAGNAMVAVTVDDGRGVANSSVSAVFEVQVAANTTPTIMITPSTGQTLLLNSTASIIVSVVDDNFNLDDIVTLEAMSSSRTIVSVLPERVTGITTDTNTTFVLSAEQDGEATITFTATDSEEAKK